MLPEAYVAIFMSLVAVVGLVLGYVWGQADGYDRGRADEAAATLERIDQFLGATRDEDQFTSGRNV